MALGIIERLMNRKAAEAKSSREQYHAIVRAIAAEGDLPEFRQAEFEQVIAAVGVRPHEVPAHVTVMAEYDRLGREVAVLPELEQARQRIAREKEAFEARVKPELERIKAERRRMDEEETAVERQITSAQWAESRRDRMAAEHPKLFGVGHVPPPDAGRLRAEAGRPSGGLLDPEVAGPHDERLLRRMQELRRRELAEMGLTPAEVEQQTELEAAALARTAGVLPRPAADSEAAA